jgi:hypothetical protein
LKASIHCRATSRFWSALLIVSVLGGGPENGLHVRRRWRARRQLGRGGGLRERAHEAREVAGLCHEQEACLVGADDERVWEVARAEDERACRGDDRLTVDPDCELALEHVEPLVLVVVDVKRRAAAARDALLGHHDAATGGVAVRLDGRKAAEEPEVLAGAGLLNNRCDRVHGRQRA